MCGDWLDRPSMYEETEPVARKQHTCDACGETIKPKQRYLRIFGVWEGEAQTIKHCWRCHQLAEALFDAGVESIDLELNCGETWDQAFGAPPPDDVAALAFALPEDFQPRKNP